MTSATEAPAAPSPRFDALAGTGTLIRFAFRRDRVRMPGWIGATVLTTIFSATSFAENYSDASDRATIATTMESPAMKAMVGVNHAGVEGYTYGPMVSHQLLAFTAVAIALMSVLLFVRHTRTEEETHRAELLRAGVVGRHASTTAAVVVVSAANLLTGLLTWLGLSSLGMAGIDSSGALLYGASLSAVGLVFVGVTAVTVQFTTYARGASGLALAVLGTAYAVRAIGDAGNSALSWLSPIGWSQATRAFVDNRWAPLVLSVVVAAGLTAAGYALSARRDVGSGLRAPRPGAPHATPFLSTPLGFGLRLHRGMLAGFGAGMLLFGLGYGSILGQAEQMLTDIDALSELVRDTEGAGVVDSFAAMVLTIMAIIASVYVVLAALRPKGEESGGRAEPLLSTGLSRQRWLGSHLVIALAGGTGVLLLGGLGFALSGTVVLEDEGNFWQLLGAAVAYAPALWVTAGVAAALYGWLPQAAQLAWVIVVYSFVVVYLGQLFQFPDWMVNFSPFGHVPELPAARMVWAPLVALTVLAAALLALGQAGFRRRDLDLK